MAYHKWGEQCVLKFNGMWAFVIYDDIKKEIFGSRDRFGIKPFFVLKTLNGFIFSSEIEPLTKFGHKITMDIQYLTQFVRQGDPEYTGSTFFNEIKELFPANNLYLNLKNQIRTKKYWDYPTTTTIKTNKNSLFKFEELLSDSITLRLRSDVDIALLLSGGVDSSLISEDIKKNNPFSISKAYCYSSGDSFDESIFAQKIADRAGLDFCKINQSLIETDYINRLALMVRRFGKGFASRSVIPISCIYEKISSDGIKVAIDGQGADELLAGYKHYHLTLLPYYLKKLKFKYALQLIKEIFTTGFLKNMMIFYRILMPDFMKYLGRIIIGYEKYIKIPFKKIPPENNFLKCKNHVPKCDDPLNSYLINQHINGLVYLIYLGDIISMNYSVENRSPFLDHRLVEFSFSTDGFFKVQGSISKYALRKNSLYKPIKKILDRKKIGFRTEISNKLRLDMVEELSNSPIIDLGIFSKVLKKDLKSNKLSKNKYQMLLFRIFQIHLWYKFYKNVLT